MNKNHYMQPSVTFVALNGARLLVQVSPNKENGEEALAKKNHFTVWEEDEEETEQPMINEE